MAKSLDDVDTALAAYKAGRADREAKQTQHFMASATLRQVTEDNAAALQKATDDEKASSDAFIAALEEEHRLEDEFEAIVTEHEPPSKP